MSVVVSDSYEFTAPAEVVFDVLTDPDRTHRWLPHGVAAESAETGRVRLRAGGQTREYGAEITAEKLQLSWHALDTDDLNGTVRVDDAPAGGSIVHAEVSVPDGVADDGRVRELLAETMAHLQRDVSDNFNAG